MGSIPKEVIGRGKYSETEQMFLMRIPFLPRIARVTINTLQRSCEYDLVSRVQPKNLSSLSEEPYLMT